MTHATDDDTLPLGTETVTAGKLILHRSNQGTVWFMDDRGQRRTVDNPFTANALFETAKSGPGKGTETKERAGTRPASNVESRATITFKPPM